MSSKMLIKKQTCRSFTLILFFIFLVQPVLGVEASNRQEEVNQHIATLTSASITAKINTAKVISRSGFTNQKLFDVIQTELLRKYLTTENSTDVDYISWLCKALASSGMDQYKSTLQKVAETAKQRKICHYASESLQLLDEYAIRAQIISSNKNTKEGRDPEVARLMNMLQSENLNLKRDAAKLITRNSYQDIDLFKVLNKEIREGLNTSNDKSYIDTMAWLCKALACSTDPTSRKRFTRTLRKVVRNSDNQKLVKYARQSLHKMNKY